MNFTTDTYNTIDGKTIFYYKWPSNKNTTLKGIVQISHGVGEHAGRYKPIARILQDEGYEVYANDHRIHGKSAKSDAFLGFYDGNNYFSDAINDMRQLSEIIKKEHPNKKIILLGHSMGSLLSREYVTKYGDDLEALILSNTDTQILTVDFNLNGKPKPKNAIFENEYGSIGEQEFIARNPQLFYDFDIPWNFNARYHFSMKNGTAGDKDKTFFDFTNFSFGGDVNITPKWKIAVQSGYDFKRKDFTLTNVRLLRDLHCWEMSLNWQAYPIQNSSFQFEIRVKSAILQDLKLSRRNPQYSNINSF